ISVLISWMGTFIHPRSFRVKQIHFVAYLGDRQPDSRRAAGLSLHSYSEDNAEHSVASGEEDHGSFLAKTRNNQKIALWSCREHVDANIQLIHFSPSEQIWPKCSSRMRGRTRDSHAI